MSVDGITAVDGARRPAGTFIIAIRNTVIFTQPERAYFERGD